MSTSGFSSPLSPSSPLVQMESSDAVQASPLGGGIQNVHNVSQQPAQVPGPSTQAQVSLFEGEVVSALLMLNRANQEQEQKLQAASALLSLNPITVEPAASSNQNATAEQPSSPAKSISQESSSSEESDEEDAPAASAVEAQETVPTPEDVPTNIPVEEYAKRLSQLKVPRLKIQTMIQAHYKGRKVSTRTITRWSEGVMKARLEKAKESTLAMSARHHSSFISRKVSVTPAIVRGWIKAQSKAEAESPAPEQAPSSSAASSSSQQVPQFESLRLRKSVLTPIPKEVLATYTELKDVSKDIHNNMKAKAIAYIKEGMTHTDAHTQVQQDFQVKIPSKKTVTRWAVTANLKGMRKQTTQEAKKYVAENKNTMSSEEMASKLGLKPRTINEWIYEQSKKKRKMPEKEPSDTE